MATQALVHFFEFAVRILEGLCSRRLGFREDYAGLGRICLN